MANTEHESAKKHGDPLEDILPGEEQAQPPNEQKSSHAIPAPDNGGHPRSPAAHLGGTVHDHTKPAGNLRHGAAPGERREPPQIVGRVGKDHRRQ